MFSVIEQNKLASIVLALAILALLTVIAFSILAQVSGFEDAGIPLVRYCVGSGGVCTGGV
ncbi:hypothetical protein [Candidatus Leptofilum sp.]|uniref:hypothetical protein n=1 Tax=Candidatus Leptofilum sp. TaxID=3241576 RepID=UPI003B5B7DA6